MEDTRTHIIRPQTTTPIENIPQEPVKAPTGPLPPELMDLGLNLDNMVVIEHLGLKDFMFEEGVLDKINEIADYLKDNEKDIAMLDLELGNPHNMTRLDKLYSYIQLEKQSAEVKKREFLINKEKEKYDTLQRLY